MVGSAFSGLTFELSGGHWQGAWEAERKMTLAASRSKCPAGGSLLERRVRHQCAALASEYLRVMSPLALQRPDDHECKFGHLFAV